MVALASDGRAAGEITVTGSSSDISAVRVNGEAVRSGRTIFSSSTIATSQDAGAILNLGKAGRIELAPNTTFALTFDSSAISGSLWTGNVTVLNAVKSVAVTTATGDVVKLGAGETASANSADPATSVHHVGHHDWLAFALIFGGAMAGIIWAATTNNENHFGSGAVVVSGTR